MERLLKSVLYQPRFQRLPVVLALGLLTLAMPARAFFHQNTAALFEIKSSGSDLLSEEVRNQIRGIKNVLNVESYLLIRTRPYDVIGLEVGAPLRIITRNDKLIQGKLEAGKGFSERSEGRTVAIVGKNVDSMGYRTESRQMGEGHMGGPMRTMRHPLQIGQTFKMIEKGPRMRVTGEYSADPDSEADKVFLPLSTAQKLFALKGKISHLFVTVDSRENLEHVSKAIEANFEGAIKVTPR